MMSMRRKSGSGEIGKVLCYFAYIDQCIGVWRRSAAAAGEIELHRR